MNLHVLRPWGVLPLLSVPVRAAHAATGPAFAAPAAVVLPAAPGGLLRVTLALALVVAAIAGTAWLMRRMRTLSGGGTGISIVAQVSLGARERAVLLRVADREVLVGVAPGNVRTLCLLGPQAQAGTSHIPVLEASHGFAAPPFAAVPPGTDAAARPAGGTGAVHPAADAFERPSFKALLLRSLGK